MDLAENTGHRISSVHQPGSLEQALLEGSEQTPPQRRSQEEGHHVTHGDANVHNGQHLHIGTLASMTFTLQNHPDAARRQRCNPDAPR